MHILDQVKIALQQGFVYSTVTGEKYEVDGDIVTGKQIGRAHV